jgi:hypothetical protein
VRGCLSSGIIRFCILSLKKLGRDKFLKTCLPPLHQPCIDNSQQLLHTINLNLPAIDSFPPYQSPQSPLRCLAHLFQKSSFLCGILHPTFRSPKKLDIHQQTSFPRNIKRHDQSAHLLHHTCQRRFPSRF